VAGTHGAQPDASNLPEVTAPVAHRDPHVIKVAAGPLVTPRQAAEVQDDLNTFGGGLVRQGE
jgi:hypothetical protein